MPSGGRYLFISEVGPRNVPTLPAGYRTIEIPELRQRVDGVRFALQALPRPTPAA